ncbi:MAG: inositol monophosphatase [Ruminococcaceae bacterium]|jgi:myo-inositol-1(or 4)-monophosphatase|nr:inositol monophosphatase [Oscillospiraceae bacterium]
MLKEIIRIVEEAGALVRSAHDVESVTREKSSASDLVTRYDEAVQELLRRRLLALLPEADFYGEEGQHGTLTRPWTFVVDPIDGTTNFVRRFPNSSISVALAHNGIAEYAVVFNPFAGDLYAAERGRGATRNGQPIHVSERDGSHAVSLFGTSLYNRGLADRTFRLMRYFFDRTMDLRRFGSAALDLCYVADGRAELFFECRLSPWDFAAGSLVVTEAGGRVTTLEGQPLDVLRPGSVFATNGLCHELLRDMP